MRKNIMTYNVALINIKIVVINGITLKRVTHNHNSPQKNIDRGKSKKPMTANIVKIPIRGLVL